MLDWLMDDIGGLKNMHVINQTKADIVYHAIDQSSLFVNNIPKDSRSMTNVVFELTTPSLEKRFITYAEAQGFYGLTGHRAVGGFRASLYNPVTTQDCKALADLLIDFEKRMV
jgi:phosphoserine aminotransferase